MRRSLSRLQGATTNLGQVWNINFSGDPYTKTLEYTSAPIRPMFSVLSPDGDVINPAEMPKSFNKEIGRHMLTTMIRQNSADFILNESQRQGRISFYMTGFGEEGANVGSAAGLKPQDIVYAQYREASVLLYRGFTLGEMIAQCKGTVEDLGRGRQMPMHYGSKKFNYHTISSPLATQIPQAAGCGYGCTMENNDTVCMCYFGDGAASEGDFHAGLNCAATLKARTLFFCRNNGYAISTPTKDQYAGDGIVCRGIGYGIPAIRVDGNDTLAVMRVVEDARAMCIAKNTPVLIEAMTYRVSHHSTSDDSTRYREKNELETRAKVGEPISRFTKFMIKSGWWTEQETQALKDETRQLVIDALAKPEVFYPVEYLVEDVFDVKTPHLERQLKEVKEHVAAHPHLVGGH
eukprot:PhF_6_TR40657/c0_g1_i2/m.61064/K00166/BCKDHA, bkdA1; 2-oxoisovalerate dehydrogenase E1 component alpha subunit